jgi:sugar-specific transcriptional regulator TrmB
VTAGDDGPRKNDRDEHDAIAALERLGLSNYEARVLIALQKLGVGTAKEIHEVAGVPRSQVYGAAEELQSRGLIELQRATPKRYRSVDLEVAREKLMANLERDRERAFDYLDAVARERPNAETRDDVWTVRGRGAVSARVVDLVGRVDERLLFGAASPALVDDAIREAIAEAAEAGVDVTVVSEDADVRTAFTDAAVSVLSSGRDDPDGFTGRVLVGDDSVVLLSVVPADASGPETAIWSADTALADVLVQITENGIAAVVGQ